MVYLTKKKQYVVIVFDRLHSRRRVFCSQIKLREISAVALNYNTNIMKYRYVHVLKELRT